MGIVQAFTGLHHNGDGCDTLSRISAFFDASMTRFDPPFDVFHRDEKSLALLSKSKIWTILG